MLPRAHIRTALVGRRVVPRLLDQRDHPWLRALLDEHVRFAGRPRRELDERLREPLPVPCPDDKLAQARHVLDRLCRDRTNAAVPPRKARRAAFVEAARHRSGAEQRAARTLGVETDALLESLFADLPGERRLCAPPQSLSAVELALRVNLAHVQGLMAHATRVEIRAYGGARDLIRHARLRGLLCTVRRADDGRGAVLELSGPLSLFRRTRVYGRALASLVPRLAWCDEYALRAECRLGEAGAPFVLELGTGDPILPAEEPKRFDSKLEQRLARDLGKRAPDWQLVREPEPVDAGGTLIFPDFALEHRRDPRRRWLVEIAGFWTPDYLERKLAHLRAAGLERLILCIDAERRCGPDEVPAGAHVVRYRKRVDPAAVMAIVDAAS